jgi:hypothetical protein
MFRKRGRTKQSTKDKISRALKGKKRKKPFRPELRVRVEKKGDLYSVRLNARRRSLAERGARKAVDWGKDTAWDAAQGAGRGIRGFVFSGKGLIAAGGIAAVMNRKKIIDGLRQKSEDIGTSIGNSVYEGISSTPGKAVIDAGIKAKETAEAAAKKTVDAGQAIKTFVEEYPDDVKNFVPNLKSKFKEGYNTKVVDERNLGTQAAKFLKRKAKEGRAARKRRLGFSQSPQENFWLEFNSRKEEVIEFRRKKPVSAATRRKISESLKGNKNRAGSGTQTDPDKLDKIAKTSFRLAKTGSVVAQTYQGFRLNNARLRAMNNNIRRSNISTGLSVANTGANLGNIASLAGYRRNQLVTVAQQAGLNRVSRENIAKIQSATAAAGRASKERIAASSRAMDPRFASGVLFKGAAMAKGRGIDLDELLRRMV